MPREIVNRHGCFGFTALERYQQLPKEKQLAFLDELDVTYGRRRSYDVVRFETNLRSKIEDWQEETKAVGSSFVLSQAVRNLRNVRKFPVFSWWNLVQSKNSILLFFCI